MNIEIGFLQMEESDLQKKLWAVQKKIRDFRRACQHKVARYDENVYHANCEECGEDLGWSCPKNPKGFCEYDFPKSGEECIHCGEPEERK